jgi:uncharacterized protein
MLNIKEIENGVKIDVLVKPKSSRNAMLGIHDGALKIAVTAAPEKGKANKAVINLLSKIFNVPKNSICIDSGETSPNKKITIVGITAGKILEILKEAGL